jgi:tripartite ATP-independent transporter DctM subunit
MFYDSICDGTYYGTADPEEKRRARKVIEEILILIICFTVLLLMNVPIAICIGMASLLTVLAIGNVDTLYIIAQRMAGGVESFPLLAIPFFILSGFLMGEGGMARRLIEFASAAVGWCRGGLGYVNVLTCMMFGSISGSAAAAVSSIGGFMIPEMNRQGYDKTFNVAITSTAATTGLLIPPSNVMIVYAVVAGSVSVADLFMAGVIPGIVVGVAIMIANGLICWKRGYGGAQKTSLKRIAVTFVHAVPSLLLIIIVLYGILGGVCSATEASAVSVAYALFLTVVVYREVKITSIPRILLQSAKTTAMVMLLVGCSTAMSWVMARENIPQNVSAAMMSLSSDKYVILLMINVILLVVGTFMDMTPAVLIFTPIFLPVVTALGLDPIHFGIILIANLCIGLCTPPVGTCLFIGCGVGKISIAQALPSLIPFFIAMFVSLLAITYIPWLSMWLPGLF